MYYFIEILYLISAASSTTLEIDKRLKFNVKLDPPTFRRQISVEKNFHDFVIQKYGNNFDERNPRVDITKKSDDSSESHDSSTDLSGTKNRSSSPQEDSSDSDDSTEKTIATALRTQTKHKKGYKSTVLTTTQRNKYEIGTTTNKKNKDRSTPRYYKSQKSRGGKNFKLAVPSTNGKAHGFPGQKRHNTNSNHTKKNNNALRLAHVIFDNKTVNSKHKTIDKFSLRNKTPYTYSNKARSNSHNSDGMKTIKRWIHNFLRILSPDRNAYAGPARMPNISIIPSSQWYDYLKNKSKLVTEHEKPQQWIQQVEEIKNITETVISNVENGSIAAQQQMQEELLPQLQDELQDLLNKTQEVVNTKINETLNIEEQLNNMVNSLDELINGTGNLLQPQEHNVEDDVKVNNFITHIPNHYSKLFRTLEKKTTDNNWKTILKKMARLYENEFKKYIKETTHHKIRSRTGTEKVILNSIGVSDRIVRRLFNFVLGDMNNKALLRSNDTINIINNELNKEALNELHRACLKLGICRTSSGFATFVTDILTILLSLDNKKFETAFGSVCTVVKNYRFADVFGRETERGIQEKVARYDLVHEVFKRAAVAIVKNIIANRNAPLVIHGESQIRQVNKTVALLEIINTLDDNVQESVENIKDWNDIKHNFLNFSLNENVAIETITTAFIAHVMDAIGQLDEMSQANVVQNAKIIFT